MSSLKSIASTLALLVSLAFIAYMVFPKDIQTQKVGSSDPGMRIEIADAPSERERGLSGRSSIPDDYGMLFVFPEPGLYGFWMKDMHVSIDIIWLNDTGNIIGIEHSVSPDTFPDSFTPPEPVRYVLETRAGYANDSGWRIGTQVPVDLPE